MPSLLSLSNELLLHIAGYLKYHGDINSYMRITGRLYYLLGTHLYRHGVDHDKSSTLEWAAEHGMESVVQKILNLGAISKTTKHTLWFILVKAMKNKHAGVVKLLLENGVKAVNQAPREWTYPACLDKGGRIDDASVLFIALINGCESTLRVMLAHELKEGPTGGAASKGDITIEGFLTGHLPLIVNCRTNGGSTALIEAVSNGTTEAVRFLLSVGADPNMISRYYITALLMAGRMRNIEAFRLLLENGARPKQAWQEWYWDLCSHSTQDEKKWDVEAASLLLKHNNIKSGITGSRGDRERLLITAVICGCTPVIQQILEKGSHQDSRPWGSRVFILDSEKPPLTTAVEWGYIDMIALMLDYGADPAPYMEYSSCNSPLNTAISQDRVDIVEMLMDRGVGLKVQRGNNNHDLLDVNILGHVIRSPSMLQVLLERGILDLNCPSTTAKLMASAVDAANAVLLQTLHDKGITLKMSARPGKFRKIRTLEAAIREGCQTVVKFLFSKGLSPKPCRYLEEAAHAKDSDTASAMIDLLLCHGTDIDKMGDVCGKGSCARKYCVCKRTEDQQMKVVRIFLDKGFSPLPESSKWARNTLVCATKREHTKVFRLLLQAINDTHGISLDDVQRNLRFLETYLYFGGPMGKLLEDCYWRKKYPVP